MSISTVDRDAAGAPYAGEAADGGPMPVAPHMPRGSENHGGASLDHGTQENDGTPENRGTHGARRTCFRFAGSMAPTPISPMPPDDATGKLRLPMPPGEPTGKSGLPMPPGDATGKSGLPIPSGVGRLRERLEDYRRRRAKQAGWTRRFVPTGLAALDAALPHGGLPCGAVTEILADDVGVGAMTLSLRIAARCVGMIGDDRGLGTGSGGLGDPTGKPSLPMPPGMTSPRSAPGSARADQDDRRYLVVVDTGNDFYPPAARQHGIELDRLIVVRVRRRKEAFWVVDQALRCRAVAVVIAALPQLDDRQSRRLQLAAESTGGIGLILRSARRRMKSFAAVRMRVEGVSCTDFGAAGLGVFERRVPCLPRSGGMGIRMLRESSIHASAAREACYPTGSMPPDRRSHGQAALAHATRRIRSCLPQ
ncbi:MAG: hypothetical protein IH897_05255 [Planctomycetes bacterium]|nr:hypothetical protein [Planctomycetota bacterium]